MWSRTPGEAVTARSEELTPLTVYMDRIYRTVRANDASAAVTDAVQVDERKMLGSQHIACHSQTSQTGVARLHLPREVAPAHLTHPLLTIRTKATFFSHTNGLCGNQTFG